MEIVENCVISEIEQLREIPFIPQENVYSIIGLDDNFRKISHQKLNDAIDSWNGPLFKARSKCNSFIQFFKLAKNWYDQQKRDIYGGIMVEILKAFRVWLEVSVGSFFCFHLYVLFIVVPYFSTFAYIGQ